MDDMGCQRLGEGQQQSAELTRGDKDGDWRRCLVAFAMAGGGGSSGGGGGGGSRGGDGMCPHDAIKSIVLLTTMSQICVTVFFNIPQPTNFYM